MLDIDLHRASLLVKLTTKPLDITIIFSNELQNRRQKQSSKVAWLSFTDLDIASPGLDVVFRFSKSVLVFRLNPQCTMVRGGYISFLLKNISQNFNSIFSLREQSILKKLSWQIFSSYVFLIWNDFGNSWYRVVPE